MSIFVSITLFVISDVTTHSTKQADKNTAQVLSLSASSGILTNPHNSLKKHYIRQGQRKARSLTKKAESAMSKQHEEDLKAQIKDLQTQLKDHRKTKKEDPSSKGRKRTAAVLDGKDFLLAPHILIFWLWL